MNRIRTDRLPRRSAAVAAALAAALSMTAGQAQAAPARVSAPRLLTGPAPGTITTIAGGVGGPGLATKVAVDTPVGVTYEAGQLFVASYHAVRDVNTQTGSLSTAVGTSAFVPLELGAQASETTVQTSAGVAVDRAGNLIVSDTDDQRILVVAASTGTFYGRLMKARHVYNVAGTGRQGIGRNGIPATQSRLDYPRNVQVDAAGNVIFADRLSARIRVVAASNGTFYGQAMTAGDIYTVAGDGLSGFSGDGGAAASARLSGPGGVTLDGSGNLVIADSGNNRVRVVAASTGTFYRQAMTAGDIYTVAGNGRATFSGVTGLASRAVLYSTDGVAAGPSGNLVISSDINNRVLVDAGATGTFYGQAMTAGHIYIVAGNGQSGYSGDGGPAVKAAFNSPSGAVVDGSGNVAAAAPYNNRIRMVAASTGTFYGQSMTAGDIYTIAGDGTLGYSGDGGPATAAALAYPNGLAVDGKGNLLIADSDTNVIRAVAASTGTFYGQPMTAGDIYTIAGDNALGPGYSGDGGPAASAQLSFPNGVSVDAAGNVVIADTGNSVIRVVAASTGTFYGQPMTAGDIYTVAGNGQDGFSGDGRLGEAKLHLPLTVTADGPDLAITDNNRIRLITG